MRWTLIDLIRRERHSKTRGPTHYPTTRTGWLLFLCNIASVSSTKTCVTEFPTVKQRVTDKCLFSRYHDSLPVTHTHTHWLCTFIYGDDVRVAECGHDLDLSADVNMVLFILDLVLPDRLYGNLKKKEKKTPLKFVSKIRFFFPSQHHIFHSKRFSTTRALTL